MHNQTKITVKPKKSLNEEPLEVDVLAGVPIIECADDSLDSCSFTIKETNTKRFFKPFDIVTLTVIDGFDKKEYEVCVLSDHAQTLSNKNGTYTHTVTCIESTKILEKTKIFNLNLTNLCDTLLQQFEKALINAEPLMQIVDDKGTVINAGKCRFEMIDDLKGILNRPGEDFRFSNTDLRSVLDGILAPCNARVQVYSIEFENNDISTIKLTYRSLTEVEIVEPVWTEEEQGAIVYEELENSGLDYAGKIVATGHNAQLEKPITVQGVFKTDSEKLSSTNASVFLPFPISEKGIKKFKLYGVTNEIPTSRSEEYELLSDSDKEKRIPYTVGSDVIPCGQYQNSAFELISLSMSKITHKSNWWESCIYTITYYPQIEIFADFSKPAIYDKDNLLLGITNTQSESLIDVNRYGKRLEGLIKRTGNDEYFLDVIAYNFTKLLPIMSKIKIPLTEKDKQDEDNPDEYFVVYKREIGVYDKFVKCRYYLSKNFNAVNKVAGVSREKHFFDTPLEYDDCPVIIKKYLVFDTENKMRSARKIFAEEFTGTIVGTLLNQGYDENCGVDKNTEFDRYARTSAYENCIDYMLFKSYCGDKEFPRDTEQTQYDNPKVKPYQDENYCFVRSALVYGQGKTINFVAKPMDNTNVEYCRYDYDTSNSATASTGGKKIAYAKYVSLDDNTNGECDRFDIWFMNREEVVNKMVGEKKPEYCYFPALTLDTHKKVSGNLPLSVKYFKDRTQAPVLDVILECVPSKHNYGNVFIGSAFCKNNLIISFDNYTLLSEKTLKLIASQTEAFTSQPEYIDLTKSDNIYKTITGKINTYFEITADENGTICLSYKNNYDENDSLEKGAWAIVDGDGEVYLAVNGILKSIYVNAVDFPY